MFDQYLDHWRLTAVGEASQTTSAWLLPVTAHGRPAILKVTADEDEQRGGRLLVWWQGNGAAQVLAAAKDAILLDCAVGGTLGQMVRVGQDDDACRIVCAVAARLHGAGRGARPDLIPLRIWFADLEHAASRHGGIFADCASHARPLLADDWDMMPLHGDLHQENILDFGARGWLAIDPKGLLGERAFDLAQLFLNPDLADPEFNLARRPERVFRRIEIVSEAASLAPKRLLSWIVAVSGLSAAWLAADDDPDGAVPLAIATLAIAAVKSG